MLNTRLYRYNQALSNYVKRTEKDITQYPKMILDLAERQNGIVTKEDVSELLKISPSQAYAWIKKLKNENKLELYCGGKYAKYILKR